MYGCESWTIKKAECRRIDAFELWCWRRLLRVPWSARGSNQSWVFIGRRSVLGVHWKDWCWSWNSNTLATWCKELTHLERPWFWERLKARGEGDDGGWDGWMVSPTRWTWVWVNSRSWWWTGRPSVLRFMGLQRVRHDWATELNLGRGCDVSWGVHLQLQVWDRLTLHLQSDCFPKRRPLLLINYRSGSSHTSHLKLNKQQSLWGNCKRAQESRGSL